MMMQAIEGPPNMAPMRNALSLPPATKKKLPNFPGGFQAYNMNAVST